MMESDGYTSSLEHLWHELSRIDQFVRAATARWKATLGADKPEQLWGMVHVSDAEIESYMASRFAPPHDLPEARTVSEPYWQAAGLIAGEIQVKLRHSDREALRLANLERRFELDRFEKDVLLVCLLPEMDKRYRRLFGYLQDDASRTRPTVELVLDILDADPAAGRLAFEPSSRLARHQLLAGLDDPPNEPLPMRSLRLDDRIAMYLLGGDAPDARLIEIVSEARGRGWNTLSAGAAQLERLRDVADWCHDVIAAGEGALVLLHGPYGAGKAHTAEAICDWLRLPLLGADTAAAARAPMGWERAVQLVYREARLRGAAVCWSRADVLSERDQPAHRVPYLAETAHRFHGLTFLAGASAWEPSGHLRDAHVLRIELPKPRFAARSALWQSLLPEAERFAPPVPDRAMLARTLANAFVFTQGQVLDAIATAQGLAIGRDARNPQLTADDLYDGCRRQSSRTLAAFATRVEPRAGRGFDDLVLPQANKKQLLELRERIANRNRVYSGLGFDRRLTLGRGLVAMFSGSSGTGKTMAAELLASDQRVDLYKIDLSAVISKYVGETEKNLSRLFEQAEDANAILFFDEADALFGKRGEVKEAKDRWANIEVNYLLQRVEEYAGVVILASNLRQNIDEAFMRRINVVVEFPAPDADARLSIWKGMFPSGIMPPDEDRLRDLAQRFRISGGSIRNAVLDGAFRALAANGHGSTLAVSARHLVLGVAREYQKLGKPITRGEFDNTYYAWVEEDLLQVQP